MIHRMDVLSDILAVLKLRGSLYFHTEFTAPWAVRVPRDADTVRFHLVVSGRCWVTVPGAGEAVALDTGDGVVIPHGATQVLADSPRRLPLDLPQVMSRTKFAGQGPLRFGGTRAATPPTRMICGFCRFDLGARHPMLAALPRMIVLRARDAPLCPWLNEAISALTYEAQGEQIGRQAMSDRLSEILFIQAVCTLTRDLDATGGFFAGLDDPVLARALAAMHAAPQKSWTVESLARESGASRSRFAEAFRDRMGVAPLAYLTDWRLQKARRLLIDTGFSIEQVAHRVGYQSLPSFSRLFKRRFGVGPAGWRREALAVPARSS